MIRELLVTYFKTVTVCVEREDMLSGVSQCHHISMYPVSGCASVYLESPSLKFCKCSRCWYNIVSVAKLVTLQLKLNINRISI